MSQEELSYIEKLVYLEKNGWLLVTRGAAPKRFKHKYSNACLSPGDAFKAQKNLESGFFLIRPCAGSCKQKIMTRLFEGDVFCNCCYRPKSKDGRNRPHANVPVDDSIYSKLRKIAQQKGEKFQDLVNNILSQAVESLANEPS